MKLETFLDYLHCYGADLLQWPETERVEVIQALKAYPQWRTYIEQEKLLEKHLSFAQVPSPAPDLAAKIVAAAARLPQETPMDAGKSGVLSWLRSLLQPTPAIALACLLVLGFALGFWGRSQMKTDSSTTDFAALLYSNEEMLWNSDSNTSY